MADLNRQITDLITGVSKKLDAAEQALLLELVELSQGDPAKLVELLEQISRIDYERTPVDMETFLVHPDYLNLKDELWPRLIDDLIECFSGEYYEALLHGAIGWGKSTFAETALARMIYEASCLRDPCKAYGLMEGSKIAFINASVNLKSAENVVFHGIKAKLNRSPYFREEFPFDADLKKEMRFPKNLWIHPVAGSESGTIGYNVLGGVLDEVNFWNLVEKSSQARGAKFDQARVVYDMLIRRIKSRYIRGGKLPGMLLQVSSSKYPDDFTEQRAEEVQKYDERHTFVRRYSTWSTQPAQRFLPEKFFLYLGWGAELQAVSKNKDDFADKAPHLVVEVPMDFWPDFNKDIDGATRDLAGYPTLAIKPFMPQRDKIQAAVQLATNMGYEHPFTSESTTLEDGAAFIRAKCKFRPNRRYFAHVDIGITKDACGVAIGHIETWKKVTHRREDGNLVEDTEPVIVIDLMLRITAPEGGEVQVDYVRALLLEARGMGANFKKITYDQYQSVGSIQAFQRIGIESEKFSVDKPMDAYNAFKEAILEERVAIYQYQPFINEVVRLEFNEIREKVDHPPKGSKDVTDAVAGVIYHCMMAKSRALIDPSYGLSTASPMVAADPSWVVPNVALSGEKTVDEHGNVLPGKKIHTEDDVLFGGLEKEESDDYIGFA